MLRRSRLAALAVLAAVGALVYALTAPAATPIPVPDPLVKVVTKSGDVTKEHLVPIGGAPVPIDVDGPSLTGVLEPDIDVSVGLVALDELPDKPVVPNVVVTRNALAIVSDRPAPPVDLNARIVLRDAANGLKRLVEVNYGFETPAGSRMPPKISAKLLGPIQGGFIDPLIAKVETPGYSGPLDLKISALTEALDARFRLGFDAMPEEILINEDPREDGLDVTYDHKAPVADVHLKATASLRNRQTNELLEVGADIERLPQHIELHNTNEEGSTEVTYASSSSFFKPDLEATYRDLDGQGGVVTDANIKVAGLPFGMDGRIETVVEDGKDAIDKVDFKVTSGEAIGGVDFVARNFDGPAGPVPAPTLQPDQYVAVGARFVGGATRWRAAGRLLDIRSVTVERQGEDNDILDARTDIGDGIRPLRAIIDVDDRPDPSVPDDEDKRLKVDTTITPLPRQIHVVHEPSTSPTDPLRLLYESSSTMDVDATAVIAEGDADGCGQAEVLCAQARVDKVPRRLEAKLPGTGGTDFSIDHDAGATQRPDVRATVDTTNEESERTWADVRILRVPNDVNGRLDTKDGVLRKAEFHGCVFDYEAVACDSPSTADALGRVSFTVRDRPDRTGLPPRPDTAAQYVTLLKRDDRFEAAGSVDEVRNVVFHQRDDDADGEADGTLGASVDVGNGGAFDVVVDDLSDFADPDDTTEPIAILGKGSTKMRIGIESLPEEFSACVRESAEPAPPAPGDLSADPLLAPCDKVDVLKRTAGQLQTTPLSVVYKANDPTKVTARIEAENPDKEDPISGDTAPYHRATSVFETTIDKVPDEIRADVISPVTPEPDAAPPVAGRKLELDYEASDSIGRIDFGMEQRRSTSLCEDPRPNRKATCMSAVLTDLPSDIFVSYDPDDTKGDIEFITSPPAGGEPRLSINKDVPSIPDPMRLSVVNPDPTSQPLVVDARITDITDHLQGKLVSKDVGGEGGLGPTKCSNGIDDDSDNGDSGGGTDAADDDCEKDLAAITFDACPDGPCDGIGTIDFKATNSLVGDPLPQPDPSTASIGGVTQDFSFIQREELFRAKGLISKLKRLGLSQLDENQDPSATTRINAAFGTGLASEKIRAYIDTDSGAEQLIADAVIAQAPSGINLCLRDGIPSGSDFAPVASSDIYCDTAPADQLAMQVALDEPAGSAKPDIDLRRLRVASGGGTSLITGDAQIDDLGERIDVLVGKQSKDGDIQVEGQQIDDDNSVPVESAPDNVAGRVTFNLRNRDVLPGGQFPWESLENLDTPGSTVDVESEGDNQGNYLKFFTDADGRFLARGSIPDIKRVAKRAGTCFADARFPDAAAYGPLNRPEYSCMQANVAGDKPLGLAVRTLDDKNEVLEVEEGHITKVPSGGLSITMAKSPEAASLDPVCTDPADAFPCRPPMLSMEAPRSDLNVVPSLRARLSVGSKDLVETVRDQTPDDTLSDNLDYEEPPKDFDEPGARVKVGTGEGDALAIRMNANLPLRQFLDLDQPTLFSCVHTVKQPDPLTQCEETGVGTDENNGYESKDIFFKLVAADNHHDGSDVDSIGRVAVLVQDYKKDGTQTVITGTPEPDDNSWFKDFGDAPTADPVEGASSYFPENLPSDTDPSNRGFMVPGHLDVKVFLRNDYNAVEDGKKQQSFAQVDGRVNRPTSLAVRLNDGLKENRDGDPVAPVQLTIRNATSSNGQDDYFDPTFRVRSELKKDWVDTSGINFGEAIYTCDGQGYGIDLLGFVTLCLVLPVNTDAQWLDVGMNMDPNMSNNTTSDNAARTVDAVAGPFGGENDADLRGFQQVNADHGDFGKGDAARFVPQAGLRLKNFNLGLKVGAGIGLVSASTSWVEEGDLIVGLTGHQPTRTRLDHNLLVMRLSGGSESHPNRINTNMRSTIRFKVTAEALFGLVEGDVINETIGDFHHNIVFRDCVGDFLPLGFNNDEFLAPASGFLTSNKTAISFGDTDDLFGDLATSFNNLITTVADSIFCLFTTDDSADVNSGHPAPSYTINSRKVDNGPGEADAPPGGGAVPPSDDTARKDLTISAATPLAERTRCGTIEARKLTIDAGVTLRVGREGEVDGVSGGQCNGALNLEVDELLVNGVIDAVGARTATNGPGSPGGIGAGAGHHGTGGASGSGSGGGPAQPGVSTAPSSDFGSAGANGSGGAAGGRGGGTVRISSVAEVTVNGSILARGSAGAGAPAACANVGGGGGSGGAIEITATRLGGSGTVSVSGGSGGDAARGGGGGSAGRITVNSVVRGANLFANGGARGDGSADCDSAGGPDHGVSGSSGTTALGTTLDRAAGVYLHPDNPGPFVKGSGKIVVKGIQQVPSGDPDAGLMDIVVCRRYLNPDDTTGGFEDPALDPGPSATLDGLLNDDACFVHRFEEPNVGTDRYQTTLTVPLVAPLAEGDGFYSWYAFAATPPEVLGIPAGEQYCSETHSGSILDPDCDYQSIDGSSGDDDVIVPRQAPTRLGSDTTAPQYTTPPAQRARNGFAGCPDDSLCLPEAQGKIRIEAFDRTAGVKNVTCTVTGGPADVQNCTPAPSISLNLGASDGLKEANVRMEDAADDPPATEGNVANFGGAVKWFRDTTKPNRPTVTLTPATCAGENGWCTDIPAISATGSDDNPSSGFTDGSLTILIDEAGAECGSAAAGSSSTSGTTAISCPAGTVAVTTEGRHVISAVAKDRLGNESDRAVNKTIKVDQTPPTVAMALGPKKPDGVKANGDPTGWYVTNPFMAFSATDKAGGSRVDPDIAPSGIFYRVDGVGSFQKFDPEADLRLGDGVHEVCFYAVDVAGNQSATSCKSDIKVDTQEPDIDDPVTPVTPDGDNGFYVTTPTIDTQATDPTPTGVNQISDVDRVEISVDDGPWVAATPTDIAEGVHVVRSRAFDKAGNPSSLLEKTIQVDRSDPSARLVTFPPRPNTREWFRRHLSESIAAQDGRDGSGADGATYTVDGLPGPASYLEPFTVTDGLRTVGFRARDFAGRQGVQETRKQKIDTLIPHGAPTGRAQNILLQLLGLPTATTLSFNAGDQLAGKVRVRVFVYNSLLGLVRVLDAPQDPDGFRNPGAGSVVWDGRDSDGAGVLPGVYHYRVHVMDEAGNTVVSDESPTFLVVQGLLPLPGLKLKLL